MQSCENAFVTVYTTPFSFCRKFNFVINELLITREELFLHDYTSSEFCIDIAVIEKKYQAYGKRTHDILEHISCIKNKSINSSVIYCSLYYREYGINYSPVYLWNVSCVCLCQVCWARFTNYAVSITHTFVYPGTIY